MKVSELIEKLKEKSQEAKIYILSKSVNAFSIDRVTATQDQKSVYLEGEIK